MIGRLVRRLAGPLEPRLADAYRAVFFDVDGFARRIASLGEPGLVVEIGCGEGALVDALARVLPRTRFVGVDVSPQVGRLFRGDVSRVRFACADATAVAHEYAGRADLVLVCDVMHHAPPVAQHALWDAAARLVRPSAGRLILKEWVKNGTPVHHLGWVSDRFITGDRVTYQPRAHWARAAERAGWQVEAEWVLAPWATNHAFVLRRRSGP